MKKMKNEVRKQKEKRKKSVRVVDENVQIIVCDILNINFKFRNVFFICYVNANDFDVFEKKMSVFFVKKKT